MTYVLQSEINLREQRADYQNVLSQMEQLRTQISLLQNSNNSGSSSYNGNASPVKYSSSHSSAVAHLQYPSKGGLATGSVPTPPPRQDRSQHTPSTTPGLDRTLDLYSTQDGAVAHRNGGSYDRVAGVSQAHNHTPQSASTHVGAYDSHDVGAGVGHTGGLGDTGNDDGVGDGDGEDISGGHFRMLGSATSDWLFSPTMAIVGSASTLKNTNNSIHSLKERGTAYTSTPSSHDPMYTRHLGSAGAKESSSSSVSKQLFLASDSPFSPKATHHLDTATKTLTPEVALAWDNRGNGTDSDQELEWEDADAGQVHGSGYGNVHGKVHGHLAGRVPQEAPSMTGMTGTTVRSSGVNGGQRSSGRAEAAMEGGESGAERSYVALPSSYLPSPSPSPMHPYSLGGQGHQHQHQHQQAQSQPLPPQHLHQHRPGQVSERAMSIQHDRQEYVERVLFGQAKSDVSANSGYSYLSSPASAPASAPSVLVPGGHYAGQARAEHGPSAAPPSPYGGATYSSTTSPRVAGGVSYDARSGSYF